MKAHGKSCEISFTSVARLNLRVAVIRKLVSTWYAQLRRRNGLEWRNRATFRLFWYILPSQLWSGIISSRRDFVVAAYNNSVESCWLLLIWAERLRLKRSRKRAIKLSTENSNTRVRPVNSAAPGRHTPTPACIAVLVCLHCMLEHMHANCRTDAWLRRLLCRDYNCDSTTIRLRSDYDVSRAPASIHRDSTRA